VRNARGRFVPTGQNLPPMVAGADPDPRSMVFGELLHQPEPPNLDPPPPTPPVPAYALEVSPAKPFRVWTAGPLMAQDRIYTPVGRLKVRGDYAYYLTSPDQVAWAQQALGKRFWPDTVLEGEDVPRCDVCDWECRSHAAMNVHLNQAHGRPQGSGR
jgi:hypothetical protein